MYPFLHLFIQQLVGLEAELSGTAPVWQVQGSLLEREGQELDGA